MIEDQAQAPDPDAIAKKYGGTAADAVAAKYGGSSAPATPPPNLNDPNGPLAVGVQQFFHDLNPVPTMQTAWDAAMHGQDPVAAAIVNPIIAQSVSRLAAARAAMAQGDHSTAALHFLGTVPVVGPIVDDLASAVRSGDHNAAAKALGDAAALAGPTLVSGGADVAAEAAAPKVGAAAQNAAESGIADAMGPQNGWGRSRAGKENAANAEKVAPAVLAAGPNAISTGGLGKFVDAQLQAASDAWNTAESARRVGRPIPTAPIIAQLQARLDSLTAEPISGSLPQRTPVTSTSPILGPNGQPIQTTTMQAQPIGQAVQGPNRSPQIAVIQGAIDRLKKLGPVATFEDLRTLRKDYDEGADYRPGLASTSEQNTASKQNASGNKSAAGAIRDALAQSDPALAKANGQYSMWQKASDVMDAADEINQSATKGGNFATVAKLMPMMLGTSAGGALGGAEGAAIGGFIGTALKAARDSGYTTQVLTSRLLGTLASAIRAGDASTVMRTIAAIGSATGTVVPAVNQSLAGAGSSVPVNIPQDPINVNLAANRGGGS